MENHPLISVRSLTRRYKMGSGELLALKNVTLSFSKGDFAGIVGPSGSGKTTLLNIIGSLDLPSEGTVELNGQSLSGLSHRESAMLRNRYIGFVFQTYNLLPVYTVFENVEFPLLLQKMTAPERKKAVMDALEWLGLTDKARSKPSQLSGGECQRVAIARAMVKRPSLVLADELSANLDAKNTHNIMQAIKKLNRELKTTFIFATHDEKVMQYLDRIITLKDGEVEKDEVILNPKN